MGKNNNNNNNNLEKEGELPHELKMVVWGGQGVGKSALVIRFIQNCYVGEYDPTIEDSYRKIIEVDGRQHLIDVLDTAGEEEYSAMRDHYILTGHMFFLVFSINNKLSFHDEILSRLEEIRRIKENQIFYCMLVGSKSDLEEEREVSIEIAMEFADYEGIPYAETSALTGEGVDEMFLEMIRCARDRTHPQKRVATIKKSTTTTTTTRIIIKIKILFIKIN